MSRGDHSKPTQQSGGERTRRARPLWSPPAPTSPGRETSQVGRPVADTHLPDKHSRSRPREIDNVKQEKRSRSLFYPMQTTESSLAATDPSGIRRGRPPHSEGPLVTRAGDPDPNRPAKPPSDASDKENPSQRPEQIPVTPESQKESGKLLRELRTLPDGRHVEIIGNVDAFEQALQNPPENTLGYRRAQKLEQLTVLLQYTGWQVSADDVIHYAAEHGLCETSKRDPARNGDISQGNIDKLLKMLDSSIHREGFIRLGGLEPKVDTERLAHLVEHGAGVRLELGPTNPLTLLWKHTAQEWTLTGIVRTQQDGTLIGFCAYSAEAGGRSVVLENKDIARASISDCLVVPQRLNEGTILSLQSRAPTEIQTIAGREVLITGRPGDYHVDVQGCNSLGYNGTCGLTSSKDIINSFTGQTLSENEVVVYAATHGLCTTNSHDPDVNGATTLAQIARLLTDYGVPAYADMDVTIEQLASLIEQDKGVLLSVNTQLLSDHSSQSKTHYIDHLMRCTGTQRDATTHELLGFYYNNTALADMSAIGAAPAPNNDTPLPGMSNVFIPIEDLQTAWQKLDGFCIITDDVLPRSR